MEDEYHRLAQQINHDFIIFGKVITVKSTGWYRIYQEIPRKLT